MSVAVWDTYVKKRDGAVMHFDIIVPATLKDANIIHQYGMDYLASQNEVDAKLESEECQFCHIEDGGTDLHAAIEAKGYYILEMDDIPASLPPDPSRRDLILHVRGHYAQHRFANLRGMSESELRALIQ